MVAHNGGYLSDDQQDVLYTSLPFLTLHGPLESHSTPKKNLLIPNRGITGCNPCRWVHDLLHQDLIDCDLFSRLRNATLNHPYTWRRPLKLVMNGNQSVSSPGLRILSSVCLDDRFHFVFKMTWNPALSEYLCDSKQSSWPLRERHFPAHHLVPVESASDAEIARDTNKYYPLLAREYFVCSAPPCTFGVTLEVSEPRMPDSWVQLLLDRKAISEQLRIARLQDPARYENASDDWACQAPLNLNTYLKDLLEYTSENARSIAKRNKRFAVLFGPRCFSMFRDLGFIETTDIVDSIDQGSFAPTVPPPAKGPSGTTEIGNYRSFLEDVRAEVQCLIYKVMHTGGQAAEQPTIITPVLHAELGCQEIPDAAPNDLVNAARYKLMGVMPNQSRQAVVNAYKCQWLRLPKRRRALVDAIMAIANDMQDDMLADFAMTQSSVYDNGLFSIRNEANTDVPGIDLNLVFFNLSPAQTHSANTVTQAFRRKLAERPELAAEARRKLVGIARNSNDDRFQLSLLMEADSKMSLATSMHVLGLSSAKAPWQTLRDGARNKLATTTNEAMIGLYLDAFDSIADHLNSAVLKQAAIELRRETLNQMAGGNATDETTQVNYSLPVGLYNIGNTCYLNSLLQYLFTVKPIRDIVLNFEDLKLDLTDESIRDRRIGWNMMQVDRGEAVVAQAFARELAKLFRSLTTSRQVSTKPSQRLANAVLLSTHTLLRSPQPGTEASKPPPLPARPSPAPPLHSAEDVEMTDGAPPSGLPKSEETASISSSKTLVDQEDASSDHSFERVEKSSLASRTDEPTDVHRVSAKTGANQGTNGTVQDVDMTDAAEADNVDQKVLDALEHQARESGTDQQDVEEVMGSMLNRLQTAIRPSRVDDETKVQFEAILDTFFVTTANYTKHLDAEKHKVEVSHDRAITAFPATDGPCSLHEALGRNFNQQMLEDDRTLRYTTIVNAPPVLHILIQRSQSISSKNENAVAIPAMLDLGRYMDVPHDSPHFERRVTEWALLDRVMDTEKGLAEISTDPKYFSHLEGLSRQGLGRKILPKEGLEDGEEEDDGEDSSLEAWPQDEWEFDGPVEDDDLLSNPLTHIRFQQLHGPEREPLAIRDNETVLRELMSLEDFSRRKDAHALQSCYEKKLYRLHAVICHVGNVTSGHYWVWIHDFEDDVWRRYNDAQVTETKVTEDVLNRFHSSGEPYFLCYVRDEDKDVFVNVPKRKRPPPSPPPTTTTTTTTTTTAAEMTAATETTATAETTATPLSGTQDAAATYERLLRNEDLAKPTW